MGERLDDIEREYFFGGLRKGLKRVSRKVLALLQRARGNIKGALLNFGKQGLLPSSPGEKKKQT